MEYVSICQLVVSRNQTMPWCSTVKGDSSIIRDGYLDNMGHLLLRDDGCGGSISPEVTQVIGSFLSQH